MCTDQLYALLALMKPILRGGASRSKSNEGGINTQSASVVERKYGKKITTVTVDEEKRRSQIQIQFRGRFG